MKKKVFLLTFIILVMLLGINSYASSTSLTASSTNVTTGTTVTVTGSVNSGAWNLTLSGNGQSKGLVGQTSTTDNASASTSISFTPTSAGSYTFTLTGDESDFFEPEATATHKVNKSITINVTAPAPEPTPTPTPDPTPTPNPEPTQNPTTPADNTVTPRLTNLGITPNDFSGFKRETFTYKVQVPNDVSKVSVYATAVQGATITSGTGEIALKEGTNVANVVVKAGDKSQTYKITIVREVADGEVTPNVTDEEKPAEDEKESETPSVLGLSKLEIEGYRLSPIFKTETTKYKVTLKDDKIKTLEDAKKLITAEANFEGAVIDITGPENFDLEKTNDVEITVSDADGREMSKYTITFSYKLADKQEENKTSGSSFWDNALKILMALIIVGLLVGIIVLKVKNRKYKDLLIDNGIIEDDEYEYYDDDEEEENDDNDKKIEDREIKAEDDEAERKKFMDEFLNKQKREFDEKDKGGKHY